MVIVGILRGPSPPAYPNIPNIKGLARSLNSGPSPSTKGEWIGASLLRVHLRVHFSNFSALKYLIPVCCSLIYSFAPLFLRPASHSFALSQGLSFIHTLVTRSLFSSSLYLFPNITSEYFWALL